MPMSVTSNTRLDVGLGRFGLQQRRHVRVPRVAVCVRSGHSFPYSWLHQLLFLKVHHIDPPLYRSMEAL